jgi:hypothetical protein
MRVQRGLHVIESTHPLILMRFPPVVDGEVVSALMATFDRALARGLRFAAVLDATDTKRLPSADARRALVDWMLDEARVARERALSVAAATVVPSGLVRAFVAALYFVRKPTAPQHWTPTLREGVEWTCARLVEAGIALTPEIERLRAEVAGEARI